MKLQPTKTAAILYAMSGIAVVGVWYIILFSANPPGITAANTFDYLVLTGPGTSWFRWFLVLPILCFAMAACHLSKLGMSKSGAKALFAFGVCLTVASLATVTLVVALPLSLAALFGYLNLSYRRVHTG